jgi:hypothetical protein
MSKIFISRKIRCFSLEVIVFDIESSIILRIARASLCCWRFISPDYPSLDHLLLNIAASLHSTIASSLLILTAERNMFGDDLKFHTDFNGRNSNNIWFSHITLGITDNDGFSASNKSANDNLYLTTSD